MSQTRQVFPNLNGLRFFAALAVIIHHVEQIKFLFHLPSHWGNTFIFNLGKQAVVLFFVLSGFLITYLLLAEQKETGAINVRYFYMRRVLRIWPLYFLIIAIGLFALPYIQVLHVVGSTPEIVHHGLFKKLLLFLFFLPNLLLAANIVIPGAAQTWSIGTEEQFYLFWPWIFKTRWNKYVCLLVVLFSYLLIKYVLAALSVPWILSAFWELFNIDCMAIGGLFALLAFCRQHQVLTFFYTGPIQLIAYVAIFIMLFWPASNEAFAVMFGIIILNLACNKSSIIKLNYPILDYLGKISYGLYMYHAMISLATIGLLAKFNVTSNWLIYAIVIPVTIAVSGLSYKYFESAFIRMKGRFQKV